MNKSTAKARNRLTGFGWLLKLLPVFVVGIAIGIVAHWALSPAKGISQEPSSPSMQEQTSEQVDYWTCSMHPEIHMPKPGLCPKCNMKLIPVRKESGDEMTSMRQFTTSESAKALMDIETVPVERKFVTAEIRMVGKVEYDETRLAYITAWVPGRLDQLYVDYTGVSVNKGDHMVYMYSPDLLEDQRALLAALDASKSLKSANTEFTEVLKTGNIEAVEKRLKLRGLTDEQIEQIKKTGKPVDHLTIYAPIGGVVIEKHANEGMYVQTGTCIYTVADLSHVWVKLDAYESDLSWLRYGQEVEFTTVSYPGEIFKGMISFKDPFLNPVTRTVKVRVDVPNQDGKLKPEMFVKAIARASVATGGKVMDPRLAGKWICPMHPSVIKDEPGQCDICGMSLVQTESLGYVSADLQDSEKPLVIPVTAALVTGTRAIVYVEVPNTDKPTYEGREIVLGPRAGNYYIVRNGLEEGERVVTKGNFKIDSALQIQAKPSMMTPEGGGASSGHMHMGASTEMEEGEGQMAMTLPAMSRQQLNSVIVASDVVIDAVKDLDLSQIHLAFAELGKTIKQVDMKLLEGHPHMLWMEMSMRLDNDTVEGQQSETLQEAQRVVESLKTNISSLKSKFGLTQMDDMKAGDSQHD